jgi:N-acetylglutamate synthase
MNNQRQSFQFQPFTMADYHDVIAFWKAQEGVGLNEGDDREGTALYLARNPGMSLIVREGDSIVAAVLCGHDGRRGYLHHLAVAASHRNRGIGKSLVRSCLERLEKAGIQKCNVFLYTDNAKGEQFWRALGYANRGDLKVMQRVMRA